MLMCVASCVHMYVDCKCVFVCAYWEYVLNHVVVARRARRCSTLPFVMLLDSAAPNTEASLQDIFSLTYVFWKNMKEH